MNKERSTSPGVAVVCEKKSRQAPEMEACLRSQGIADAQWFSPKDVDDVDDAVRDGRVKRVVFPDPGDLFMAIWEGEICFDTWMSNEIEVSFCAEPADQAETVKRIYRGWSACSARRQKRQARAGAILSVVVLVAAVIVIATDYAN